MCIFAPKFVKLINLIQTQMRRKLLFAIVALMCSIGANAQASYNQAYTTGSTVAAGGDYFLYNIGAGAFLTGGMDWGSHASADHAGKVITLASKTSGNWLNQTRGYSINTAYYSANGVENSGYLTSEGYTDGADDVVWVFTKVNVSGYTNVYTITNGNAGTNNYLYYNPADTRVEIGANTGDNYSRWILISKSARDNVGDYTYYLQNVGINRFWERACWAECTWGNDGIFTTGGNADNPCGEKYHGVVDFYQTVSQSVPNGKYTVYAQGFYRQEGGASEAAPMLYANSSTQDLQVLTGSENSMGDASTSFSNGNYVNEVSTIVTDQHLRVGINVTGTHQWVIWDNFALKYLGTCLINDAQPLPTGNMTANQWYYFDINIAADDYRATASTNLNSIICYNDGTVLTSEATTGNVTLTATGNSFSVGRYYVKSSTRQTLTISSATPHYAVGAAEVSFAEGGMIKAGQVINVTFPLYTTASSATATINLSGVTFGGNTINNVTQTSNGFNFTVPSTVTLDTDYVLSIPAGAITYGTATNEAATFTWHTAYFADGTYYLRNTDFDYAGKYLTRGAYYGTQAILGASDDALAVTLTLTDGTYTIQFNDTQLYLGHDEDCYTDKGSNDANLRHFIVTRADGGYKFMNTNNNKYLAVRTRDVEGSAVDGVVANAVEGGNLVGTTNVWALDETKNDFSLEKYFTLRSAVQALYDVANYEELTTGAHTTLGNALDAAATAVAAATTDADIVSITNTLKAAGITYASAANPTGNDRFDLTFMLTDPDLTHLPSWRPCDGWYTDQEGGNCQVMNNDEVTSTDGTKTKFYEYWSENAKANNAFDLYLKVTLPEGSYELSCYAFAQDQGHDGDTKAGVYFYVDDIQGSLVANDRLEFKDVEFLNTTEHEVKVGLKSMSPNTYNWMGIGYVELYKVPAHVVLDETIAYNYRYAGTNTAKLTRTIYAGFNTVMLPFSLNATEIEDIFGAGTLYAFTDADGGMLNFTETTTLSANTPYLFKANAAEDLLLNAVVIPARTFVAATAAQVASAGTDYNLVGTYTPFTKNADANPIVVGADYILGADDNFHLTTVKNALKAFRAYLKANEPTENPAKALRINLNGIETAIQSIDGEKVHEGAIYNLAGQRVSKTQKGIYIQNGKKVAVK